MPLLAEQVPVSLMGRELGGVLGLWQGLPGDSLRLLPRHLTSTPPLHARGPVCISAAPRSPEEHGLLAALERHTRKRGQDRACWPFLGLERVLCAGAGLRGQDGAQCGLSGMSGRAVPK